MALDNKWGTVKVLRYSWPGRIAEAGLENLTLASDYDKKYPKDEDHCWTGVSIENAENCWVRRVNFKHFAGSAVIVQRTGSKTTVEDCRHADCRIQQCPLSMTCNRWSEYNGKCIRLPTGQGRHCCVFVSG